jgi:hypothetical protein
VISHGDARDLQLDAPYRLVRIEYTRQTALLAGVAAENIYTVLNPTPAHDEATVTDRKAMRAALGYGPDTPLVISVGRLDPGKGHMALFEAFAEVVKDLHQLDCSSAANPSPRQLRRCAQG